MSSKQVSWSHFFPNAIQKSSDMTPFVDFIENLNPFFEQKFYYEHKFAEFAELSLNNYHIKCNTVAELLQQNKEYLQNYFELMTQKIKKPHPFIETSHYYVKCISNIHNDLYKNSIFLLQKENEEVYNYVIRNFLYKQQIQSFLQKHIQNLDIYALTKGDIIIDNALNRIYSDLVNANRQTQNKKKTFPQIRDELIVMAKEVGIVPNLDERDGMTFYYDSIRVYKESFDVQNPFDPDFSINKENENSIADVFTKLYEIDPNTEMYFKLILESDNKTVSKYLADDNFGIHDQDAKNFIQSYKKLRFVIQKRLLQDIMETVKAIQTLRSKNKDTTATELHQMIQNCFTIVWKELLQGFTRFEHYNPSADSHSYLVNLLRAELYYQNSKYDAILLLDKIQTHTKDTFFLKCIDEIVNDRVIQCSPLNLQDDIILRLAGDEYRLLSKILQDLFNMHVMNTRYTLSRCGKYINYPFNKYTSNDVSNLIPTANFEIFQEISLIKSILKKAPKIIQTVSEAFAISTPLMDRYMSYGFWKSFQVDKFPFPYSPENLKFLDNSSKEVQSLFFSKYLDIDSDILLCSKDYFDFLQQAFLLRQATEITAELVEKYNKQTKSNLKVQFANEDYHIDFTDKQQIIKILKQMNENKASNSVGFIETMIRYQKKYNILLESLIVYNNFTSNLSYIEQKFKGTDPERYQLFRVFFKNEPIFTDKLKFKTLYDLPPISEDSFQLGKELKILILQNELMQLTSLERQFLSFNPAPHVLIVNSNKHQKFISIDSSTNGTLISPLIFPNIVECSSIKDEATLIKCVHFVAQRYGLLNFARYYSSLELSYEQVIQNLYKNKLSWNYQIFEGLTVDSCELIRKLLIVRFRLVLFEHLQSQYSKSITDDILKRIILETSEDIYFDKNKKDKESEIEIQKILSTYKQIENNETANDIKDEIISFKENRYLISTNYTPKWANSFCNVSNHSYRTKIFSLQTKINISPINEDHLNDLTIRFKDSYFTLVYSFLLKGYDSSKLDITSIFDVDPVFYTRSKKVLTTSFLSFQAHNQCNNQHDALVQVVNDICRKNNEQILGNAKKPNLPNIIYFGNTNYSGSSIQIINKPEFYRKSLRIEPLRSFYNAAPSEINRQFNQEYAYASQYMHLLMHEAMTMINPALLEEYKFTEKYLREVVTNINNVMTYCFGESHKKIINTWTAYLSNMISDYKEAEIPILVCDSFKKLVLDTIEATYSFDTSYKLEKQIHEMNALRNLINYRLHEDSAFKSVVQQEFKKEIRKLIEDLKLEKEKAKYQFDIDKQEIVDAGLDTVTKYSENDISVLTPQSVQELVEGLKKKIETAKSDIEQTKKFIAKTRVLHSISPVGIRKLYQRRIDLNRDAIRKTNKALWGNRQLWIIQEQEINRKMKTDLSHLANLEWAAEDLREEIDSSKLEIDRLTNANAIIQKNMDDLERQIRAYGVLNSNDEFEKLLRRVVEALDELEQLEEDSEKLDAILQYEVREPQQKIEKLKKENQRIRYEQMKQRTAQLKQISEIRIENERIRTENAFLKGRIAAIEKENELKNRLSLTSSKKTSKSLTDFYSQRNKTAIVSPRRRIVKKP